MVVMRLAADGLGGGGARIDGACGIGFAVLFVVIALARVTIVVVGLAGVTIVVIMALAGMIVRRRSRGSCRGGALAVPTQNRSVSSVSR